MKLSSFIAPYFCFCWLEEAVGQIVFPRIPTARPTQSPKPTFPKESPTYVTDKPTFIYLLISPADPTVPIFPTESPKAPESPFTGKENPDSNLVSLAATPTESPTYATYRPTIIYIPFFPTEPPRGSTFEPTQTPLPKFPTVPPKSESPTLQPTFIPLPFFPTEPPRTTSEPTFIPLPFFPTKPPDVTVSPSEFPIERPTESPTRKHTPSHRPTPTPSNSPNPPRPTLRGAPTSQPTGNLSVVQQVRQEGAHGLGVGTIAGIVVGLFAMLILVCCLTCFVCGWAKQDDHERHKMTKKKQQQRRKKKDNNNTYTYMGNSSPRGIPTSPVTNALINGSAVAAPAAGGGVVGGVETHEQPETPIPPPLLIPTPAVEPSTPVNETENGNAMDNADVDADTESEDEIDNESNDQNPESDIENENEINHVGEDDGVNVNSNQSDALVPPPLIIPSNPASAVSGVSHGSTPNKLVSKVPLVVPLLPMKQVAPPSIVVMTNIFALADTTYRDNNKSRRLCTSNLVHLNSRVGTNPASPFPTMVTIAGWISSLAQDAAFEEFFQNELRASEIVLRAVTFQTALFLMDSHVRRSILFSTSQSELEPLFRDLPPDSSGTTQRTDRSKSDFDDDISNDVGKRDMLRDYIDNNWVSLFMPLLENPSIVLDHPFAVNYMSSILISLNDRGIFSPEVVKKRLKKFLQEYDQLMRQLAKIVIAVCLTPQGVKFELTKVSSRLYDSATEETIGETGSDLLHQVVVVMPALMQDEYITRKALVYKIN